MSDSAYQLRSPNKQLHLTLNGNGEVLRFFEAASAGEIDYFHRPAGNVLPLMHPWCNRVEGGRFTFNGETHLLRPLHAPENNALHGHWQRPWRVTESTEHSAVLEMSCAAENTEQHKTPYAYDARQVLTLTDYGLHVGISLSNRGQALPFGLGLHPFLPRPQDTVVQLDALMMENCRADMIPDPQQPLVPVPPEWTLARGFTVSNENLNPPRRGFNHGDLMDNCFVGIDPAKGATVTWPSLQRRMAITASANCRFGVIFVPGPGNDAPPGALSYFCVELCTNGINMQNRGDDAGTIVLQPGETLAVETHFKISHF